MSTKFSIPFKEDFEARFGEHVLRVIEKYIAAQGVGVEEARNKLSSLIDRAHDGKCQVIGKRDPALLMSYDLLGEMLLEASRPATWGEAFEPTAELPGIDEPLFVQQDSAPRARFLIGGEAAAEGQQIEDQQLRASA